MLKLLDLAPNRTREFYDAVKLRLQGDEAALHQLRDLIN